LPATRDGDLPGARLVSAAEVQAMAHRNSHYWLWFLIFGAIPFIQTARAGFPANTASYSAYWLVGAGLLGLLLGLKSFNDGKLAPPFDVIVGIIFTIAGIVGILGYFSISLGGVATIVNDIGLETTGLYPLIFAFLGLKSIHHGLDKK
jgi:hypothetical protein